MTIKWLYITEQAEPKLKFKSPAKTPKEVFLCAEDTLLHVCILTCSPWLPFSILSQFWSFFLSSLLSLSLFFSPFTSTTSSHPQIKTQSAKGPLGVCGKTSPHISSSHPGPVLPLSPPSFFGVSVSFSPLPSCLSLPRPLSLHLFLSPSHQLSPGLSISRRLWLSLTGCNVGPKVSSEWRASWVMD